MVKEITTIEELDEEINNWTSYTVLYFTATWCGPCKQISPFIQELDKNSEILNVKFLKIDVDEADDLCEKFEVQSMPTFIFLDKEQNVTDSLIGANKELLSEKIKNLFTDNNSSSKPQVDFNKNTDF
jgi:thioredoxin 1